MMGIVCLRQGEAGLAEQLQHCTSLDSNDHIRMWQTFRENVPWKRLAGNDVSNAKGWMNIRILLFETEKRQDAT